MLHLNSGRNKYQTGINMPKKNTFDQILKDYERRRTQLIERINNWKTDDQGRYPHRYYNAKRKLEALDIEINKFLVMNGKRTTETEKEREERKAWSTSKTGHTVWTRPDGLGRPTLGTAWDNKRQKFNTPEAPK